MDTVKPKMPAIFGGDGLEDIIGPWVSNKTNEATLYVLWGTEIAHKECFD